ncbi:3-isopropylmalate dehydratase large subunit [Aggregatilinea lenta]|uniref:3-isopropylmalate dehydratase large subunit n=1 Tax=Aggregatilinea lenta TaxID=913108 RepID=UPI000E5B8FBE|nr:3-isopropylmalate dehydratase large subunit [Aggregatilinea lenta]
MGKTLAEKIIAAHAEDAAEVSAGDLVTVHTDVVMANDVTAAIAIESFNAMGVGEVYNKDRIMLVPSHFAPNKDIKSAEQTRTLTMFAQDQTLTNRFQVGRAGIEHVVLPERGLVLPGDLVVGGDSHTCTYGAVGAFSTGMGSTDIAFAMATGKTWLKVPETMKFVYSGTPKQWVYGKDLILRTIGEIGVDGALYRSMEFTGPAINALPMSERLTMTNMIIEAGGKCGFMPFDDVTREYVEARATRSYTPYFADDDATYTSVHEFEVSDMEPQVACPYSPDNVHPISEVKPEKADQVFIGSCTNGRYEDLAIVADILQKTGREFHPDVRVMIIPGSQAVYLAALRAGWIELFTMAGAAVSVSTCGPCLGGHMGVLASNEVCVSTSNRNFRGRMGHRDARVFLANPAIATASAIIGRLAHPDEL